MQDFDEPKIRNTLKLKKGFKNAKVFGASFSTFFPTKTKKFRSVLEITTFLQKK